MSDIDLCRPGGDALVPIDRTLGDVPDCPTTTWPASPFIATSFHSIETTDSYGSSHRGSKM